MLLSGSVLRVLLALLYLLSISTASVLTYFFYSEPALFMLVCSAVSLLVLSYPMLCVFEISRNYDLEVGCANCQWIPISSDLEAQNCCSNANNEEKPSKLDLAFAHAYI